MPGLTNYKNAYERFNQRQIARIEYKTTQASRAIRRIQISIRKYKNYFLESKASRNLRTSSSDIL